MQIQSLVQDIYTQVQIKGDWFNEDIGADLGREVSIRLQEQFKGRTEPPRLRLSQMGPRCPRALWYSIHHPELAESLPPWATIKYTYGHILEAMAISLAKASGHLVTGEQDELVVDGIKGHRDCVIDGCIVDVKSTSSFSFNKFKDGSLKNDDSFGYLDQLDGYLVGSLQDPLVLVKDKAYILAIDKQLGHMALYEHNLREESIRERIATNKRIVDLSEPPTCQCGTVADGKSGNIKLDVKASYSPYKFCCKPSLRTFLYASGPTYLTHVARKPDVIEIDSKGNKVYNHE